MGKINKMNFELRYTLEVWLKSRKPEHRLIVQASTEDGSDGITNSPIGMSWQYVRERGNSVACQVGNHKNLVLCAISSATDMRRRQQNPINRKTILETLSKRGIKNISLDPSKYFASLPTYKFVISPEGNGIDCHRHYEALMAGCIPIVEESELIRKKYGNVPILYTRDYSEISEAYLTEKYEEMLKKEWNFANLFINNWNEEEQELIKLRGNFWCMRLAGEPWYLEKCITATGDNGRLCNQIIRNLATSLIAEKHNLKAVYFNSAKISMLGIDFFSGSRYFNETKEIHDSDFFPIMQAETIDYNLNPNGDYFQTKEITRFLHSYLHSDKIKTKIMQKNQFNARYGANNDLFIHIRLGDVADKNPGIQYYLNAIQMVKYDNLYISTDTPWHDIVKKIFSIYPQAKLVQTDEITTIQIASTCKNVILSHGSFSAVIGYLSFFSTIYYPKYEPDKIWYGDMFSIDGWIRV